MPVDEAHVGFRRVNVLLAPDVDAPAAARDALRALPLGARERDVLLLTSELVTNAVLHADLAPDQPIELDAACDPARTRVEVRDAGRGFRPRAAPDGYGLSVVAAVTDRWGVERDGGTCVWFEVG